MNLLHQSNRIVAIAEGNVQRDQTTLGGSERGQRKAALVDIVGQPGYKRCRIEWCGANVVRLGRYLLDNRYSGSNVRYCPAHWPA